MRALLIALVCACFASTASAQSQQRNATASLFSALNGVCVQTETDRVRYGLLGAHSDAAEMSRLADAAFRANGWRVAPPADASAFAPSIRGRVVVAYDGSNTSGSDYIRSGRQGSGSGVALVRVSLEEFGCEVIALDANRALEGLLERLRASSDSWVQIPSERATVHQFGYFMDDLPFDLMAVIGPVGDNGVFVGVTYVQDGEITRRLNRR